MIAHLVTFRRRPPLGAPPLICEIRQGGRVSVYGMFDAPCAELYALLLPRHPGLSERDILEAWEAMPCD
jgi:hypothetical protein